MSGAAAPAELAVRRLRVVDRGDDALRARLAAERLLSIARPRPRGLPAGAVLVVRSLALRAPSGFDADSAAALARWRTAAEDALEARLRAAARPAWEPVPADAPAVLFADRAELLACLAEDLAAGVVSVRWWWRAELGAGAGERDVAARWEADAAEVPAALELLAARGRAAEAVRALAPDVAVRIVVAVATAHAVVLPDGWPAVPDSSASDAAPSSTVRVRRATRVTTVPGASRAAEAAAAPAARWAARAPEAAAAGLAPPQRALLGLALTLRRDRPLARAAAFAPAFARWWAQVAAPPARPADRPSPPPSASAAAPRSAAHTPAATRPTATAPAPARAIRPPGPLPADPPATGTDAARPLDATATPRSADALPPPIPDARRFVGLTDPQNVTHPREPAPAHTRAFAPAIPTALGGLFLLVNLGLYLDLYGDFTRPRAPGIALDAWDFAALLGRELLPEARRPRGRLARDPAWRLLAELAGCDRTDPPGAGFHAPRAWRVPRAWLAPFDGARGAWRWSPADGRLRLLHPAGFLALDVPARGAPAAQLARALARLGAAARVRDDDAVGRAARPADGIARPALARWVGWLAPYAAARLKLALAARTPAAAARTTLLLPARVAIAPGRVDVTVPLAALPLALRRAGLDRTPGWVPAAGRHVAFHFAA